MQFGHNDDYTKEKFTYVDRMTPLGIPDENGIYPTVVPDDSMKVPADDVPQEYAGLLRVEGHSEETIAEYVKKYEAVVASYGEKYWPYNCKATYKGYLKYYIDKVRELGATPVIVTSAARHYFKEGRIIAVPGHHGGSDKFGDFPYVRAAKQIAEQENAVKNDPVQATGAAKTTENATGYQDAAGYQNNSGYQDAAGYQNNSGYQNVTGYQNNGQKPEINYVPYLVLSIISTVCCCLPFGIVGIVFSVKINSALNAGNYEEAAQNAKMAKIWTIVSFVVGLVVGILYFMFGIIEGIDNYY